LSGSAVTTVSACALASNMSGQTPSFSANFMGSMSSTARDRSAFASFSDEMKNAL
jgi:hypothetical protein